MSEDIKDIKDIKVFTVMEKVGDKEIPREYAVRKPSGQEGVEAQKIYARAWNDALKSGAPLRAQVDTILIERGLWSAEKEKELVAQAKVLQKEVDKLNKGGTSLTEGKKLSASIRNIRYDFNRLALEKNVLDNNTVEGQAEIAKINYLISVCTVYNHGSKKRVYDSLDDFYNRSSDKVAMEATNSFMNLVYNINTDYEKEYPENKFLLKYKFVNDKLQFLNENNKPYDPDTGRLINEDGRWINDNGEFINSEDKPVKEDGTLKFEVEPFFDDNGNPVE